MTDSMTHRFGALSGVLFAVLLFVSSSAHGYAALVVGIAALALYIPFLATLCSRLREAGGGGPLSATAYGAGLAAIVIKLVSVVPEVAERDLVKGTATYRAFQSLGDAAFSVALYPLAILFAALAVLALRTGALPRWLGVGAAVTAVALAVNAGFIDASFGPAFLLFLLWTLVAGVVLSVRDVRAADPAPQARPQPASS